MHDCKPLCFNSHERLNYVTQCEESDRKYLVKSKKFQIVVIEKLYYIVY